MRDGEHVVGIPPIHCEFEDAIAQPVAPQYGAEITPDKFRRAEELADIGIRAAKQGVCPGRFRDGGWPPRNIFCRGLSGCACRRLLVGGRRSGRGRVFRRRGNAADKRAAKGQREKRFQDEASPAALMSPLISPPRSTSSLP